jgi:hypothetical protein
MEFSTLRIHEGAVFVPRSCPTLSAPGEAPRLTELGTADSLGQVRGLVEELESITDPRGLCGLRYRLSPLLALVARAMTPAGNDSITAAAEWCERATAEELAAFAAGRDRRGGAPVSFRLRPGGDKETAGQVWCPASSLGRRIGV